MRAILLAIIILFGTTASGGASNSEEFQQIYDEVKAAYLKGEFERLDKLIATYHRDDARTASGSLKAEIFYVTLESTAFLYGGMSHETLNQMEAQADRWIAAEPDSPAARIVKAMALSNRAWNARGDKFGHELTQDQRQAFGIYIEQARSYSESVKREAGNDPQWYATMLDINRSAGARADFIELAEEALETYPTYMPIHWEIVQANLPVWYGTPESMEYWVSRIADATGTDESYARAYWVAADSYYLRDLFDSTKVDWSRFKAGFQSLVRNYPTTWNLNNFARFSCLAQDKEQTRAVMSRLDKTIDSDAWSDRHTPAYCLEWAFKPDPKNLPAMEEFILVEAYSRDKDGILRGAFGPMEQPNEQAAVAQAERLSLNKVYEGVRAYKLVPNPNTRTYGKPIILFKHGIIPNRRP